MIAPTVTWRINDAHALTVDYEHFERRSTRPSTRCRTSCRIAQRQFRGQRRQPHRRRRLTDPVATTFDYGLQYPFPLPKNFNWTGRDDWRTSKIDGFNGEYVGKLSDNWTVRGNAAYQRNEIRNRPPASVTSRLRAGHGDQQRHDRPSTVPGATAMEKSAYLTNIARQFAARVLADPNVVFESPYIFQNRRKRLTADEQEPWSYQAELAGNF